jgi:hypothetical protein
MTMMVTMNYKEKMSTLLAQKVNSNELNKSFLVNNPQNCLLHLPIKVNHILGGKILVKVQHNKGHPEVRATLNLFLKSI